MIAPTAAAPTQPPVGPPVRSRRRVWLFRLGAVAMSLLVLGLCEIVLRWSGFGSDYGLVVDVPDADPSANAQLNGAVDRVYFGSRDMLGPEPRRFALPKPTGVYRIVVLGASTVNGFPYASEIAFPRQVELLLEAQGVAEDVEVLNAGITAINSFEVADLAGDCRSCQPDLVVIHAGHNEFFGPGGPGSSVLPLPAPLVKATFSIRRSRLGQLLGALVPAPAPSTRDPISEFPRLTEIHADDPEFAAALENYRRNLQQAVTRLQAAGIPVLLTTVASNLKDQAPIRSVFPREMASEEQAAAVETLQQVEQQLLDGQPAAAKRALEEMPAPVRQSARWQYRYAQALEAAGDREEASRAYALARDYDGCRFRAPSPFGEVVRQIAAGASPPGVRLLDLEAFVNAHAAGAAPGHDLFLEHVHYNLHGHRLLAPRIARAVCEDCLGRRWDPGRDPTDAQLDEQLQLLPEDELAGASFALQAVEAQPLAGAADADRVQDWLREVIGQRYAELPPARQQAFADLSLHDMQHDLAGALARRQAELGQPELSRELAEAGVVRRPWDAGAWLLAAQARVLNGDDSGAIAAAQTALRLDPQSTPARELLQSLGAQTSGPNE